MKRVLIIDDNPSFRRLLGELLRQNGWKVFEAEDGKKGVFIAKSKHPDVVIVDLLMPRGNGFRACRELRADPSLAHTKIIVTSGRDFSADRQTAKEAGADEYLTKPVDPKQLLNLLNRFPASLKSLPIKKKAKSSIPSVRIKFWGVRGSIATPGPDTVYYGGNTSCIEIRIGNQIIILDAGTGLRLLGRALVSESQKRTLNLTLLLTHTHWDHIQGLPFFEPIYRPNNQLRILGYEGARASLTSILSGQMESPYFPIGLDELPANVVVEELKEMQFNIGAVRVETFFANHPGICVGYRLFTPLGSIVYLPDNELRYSHRSPEKSQKPRGRAAADFARTEEMKLIDFLRGAEVLIMDTQYDHQEYEKHIGWGHGCMEDVTEIAIKARVGKLFLFHHDPGHDDKKISQMEKAARKIAAARRSKIIIQAAREGLVLNLAKNTPRAGSF